MTKRGYEIDVEEIDVEEVGVGESISEHVLSLYPVAQVLSVYLSPYLITPMRLVSKKMRDTYSNFVCMLCTVRPSEVTMALQTFPNISRLHFHCFVMPFEEDDETITKPQLLDVFSRISAVAKHQIREIYGSMWLYVTCDEESTPEHLIGIHPNLLMELFPNVASLSGTVNFRDDTFCTLGRLTLLREVYLVNSHDQMPYESEVELFFRNLCGFVNNAINCVSIDFGCAHGSMLVLDENKIRIFEIFYRELKAQHWSASCPKLLDVCREPIPVGPTWEFEHVPFSTEF